MRLRLGTSKSLNAGIDKAAIVGVNVVGACRMSSRASATGDNATDSTSGGYPTRGATSTATPTAEANAATGSQPNRRMA